MVVSGAATLSPDVEEFMRVCLGCVAGQGKGLRERCGVAIRMLHIQGQGKREYACVPGLCGRAG